MKAVSAANALRSELKLRQSPLEKDGAISASLASGKKLEESDMTPVLQRLSATSVLIPILVGPIRVAPAQEHLNTILTIELA